MRAQVISAFSAVLLAFAAQSSAQIPAVPRFELSECVFPLGPWANGLRIECGWLVVLEQRSRPEGRTLRLAVAILRSQNPSAIPLVNLHGGPGVSGFPGLAASAQELARQNRDFIFYDQRGAGYSEPQLCPDLTGDTDQSAGLARACLAWMLERGFDRTAYTTPVNAQDLIDLRRVLGYEQWDIQGESYGSRLAQEAMRLDAQAIRSVTLVAPSPTGPVNQLESPLSHQNALYRVFAACTADAECRTAFPDPRGDYFATFDDLALEPLRVPRAPGATADTALLTAELFRNRIRRLLSAGTVSRLPLIVHEFQRGDRIRAARALLPASSGGEDAEVSRFALTQLIFCYDAYFPGWAAAADSINTLLDPVFRSSRTHSDCEIWLERLADSSHADPVRSEIPTLIAVGELDESTPPEHARLIASTLPNAYVFEFPGLGHGLRHPCVRQIVQQFRRDPSRPPDRSCIAQMPKIAFVTRW